MSENLKQLHNEILSYSYSGFLLGRDLENLQRAREAKLREATVLYATRILEALSVGALQIVGLDWKENTFANLGRIESYGLIPQHTLYWAHALRRIGNQIRHAKIEAQPEEEEATVAFLEYWLRWFFCKFPYGPLLSDLTSNNERSVLIRANWLSRIMSEIESNDLDPVLITDAILSGEDDYEIVMQVPAIIAVLAEKLLRNKKPDKAEALLHAAIRLHPEDLRLLQLIGLCYSRTEQLQKALDHLEPLYKRYNNDDEMIGIMAGVYKRLWQQNSDSHIWLRKSYKAYTSGWKRDKQNTYLGINVATTALFLGDRSKSEKIAEEVREVLLNRRNALKMINPDYGISFNLWDQLTLAEAEMLLGNGNAAGKIFMKTKRDNKNSIGYIETCRDQLRIIRKHLGKEARDTEFLDEPL